jgi:hypothetical protein
MRKSRQRRCGAAILENATATLAKLLEAGRI